MLDFAEFSFSFTNVTESECHKAHATPVGRQGCRERREARCSSEGQRAVRLAEAKRRNDKTDKRRQTMQDKDMAIHP